MLTSASTKRRAPSKSGYDLVRLRTRCSGTTHYIVLTSTGRLVLCDHDADTDAVMEALTGQVCRCRRILNDWRGVLAREDLKGRSYDDDATRLSDLPKPLREHAQSAHWRKNDRTWGDHWSQLPFDGRSEFFGSAGYANFSRGDSRYGRQMNRHRIGASYQSDLKEFINNKIDGKGLFQKIVDHVRVTTTYRWPETASPVRHFTIDKHQRYYNSGPKFSVRSFAKVLEKSRKYDFRIKVRLLFANYATAARVWHNCRAVARTNNDEVVAVAHMERPKYGNRLLDGEWLAVAGWQNPKTLVVRRRWCVIGPGNGDMWEVKTWLDQEPPIVHTQIHVPDHWGSHDNEEE